MRVAVGILSLVALGGNVTAAPLRVGFVADGKQRAFADGMRAGAMQAAKELSTPDRPIELVWREPAKPGDRTAQARLVDDLAGEKVDALLLDAIDRQVLRAPVERAVRAGVPVITIDSGVDGDGARSIVTTDNREAGREAARLLAKLIDGRGGVLLLRYQIQATKTEQREEGFIEAITRGFPHVQLVASDYHAGPTIESATRVAETLLRRYAGKIDAVFASSESGTAGMLAMLRHENLADGRIKFVGSDEAGDVLAPALRAGDVQGYVAENPQAMGVAAMTAALAAVRGEVVPRAVATPLRIVSADGATVSALAPPRAALDLVAGVDAPACVPTSAANFRSASMPPVPGENFAIVGLGTVMVAVKPGAFVLSAGEVDANGGGPGGPARVTLAQPYWLGKYEVTQREWTQVMKTNPSDFHGDCLPVDNIAWTDATAFCQRLTEGERAASRLTRGYHYTLPTDAQWEYAARAGGDVVTDPATLLETTWCVLNSGAVQPTSGAWRMGTHPVGTKAANAWGFCDMNGNVSEWCLDLFAPVPAGAVADPRGAASATYHVLRGGAWWTDVQNSRADTRHGVPPARHHNGLGFRLALAQDGGMP
jgi:ribose transport system substrate-binding protein